MRSGRLLLLAGMVGLASTLCRAQLPPPSILKEDCTKLRHKEQLLCEARNNADTSQTPSKPSSAPAADTPTGADADVPGEPPSPRVPLKDKLQQKPDTSGNTPTGEDADVPGEPPSPKSAAKGAATQKPDTSDMPTGQDADPPASSMGPLRPDGTPDTAAPAPAGSDSRASSTSAADDDDAAPTVAGADSPVKAATLKDLGSHADMSKAKAALEANRVAEDVKVGRFYMQTGNMAGAEMRFKDALAHDPGDPDAHFAMAEYLLKQKRNAEAAAELQLYLKIAPDDDHTREAKKLLAKLGK